MDKETKNKKIKKGDEVTKKKESDINFGF